MWDLKIIDINKPLYLAVVEALERDIASGVLQPGDRMPTHRSLAKKVGITLSTASRIYHEAGKRGLITAVVGRGTFITADAGKKSAVIDVNQSMLDWDLGIASPIAKTDPDILPLAEVVMHRKRFPSLMSYPSPQGLLEHRSAGSDWVARFGIKVPAQNIVITAGAHHALFIICNSLLTHGDRIATDFLTYPGIKTAAQRNAIRLEGVHMDADGMLPQELDMLCRRQNIKAVYVSGRFQNPTNREMSATRRMELREVISRHGLILIENDSYGFLNSSKNQTLSALLPNNSIYISSLSKAFYAGLRIAYVAPPPHIVKKLTQGIADTMLAVSPFCAEIASESIRTGLADISIRNKKTVLAKRRALFEKIFADYIFESSPQSMFIWLKLPSYWKGAALEAEAARHNIRIFSAEKFVVGAEAPPEAIRISLTGVENMASLKKTLHQLEQLISRTGKQVPSPCTVQ